MLISFTAETNIRTLNKKCMHIEYAVQTDLQSIPGCSARSKHVTWPRIIKQFYVHVKQHLWKVYVPSTGQAMDVVNLGVWNLLASKRSLLNLFAALRLSAYYTPLWASFTVGYLCGYQRHRPVEVVSQCGNGCILSIYLTFSFHLW